MSKLEIGSMVRVKDSYMTSLVGKIGKVVAYAGGETITVQFEGMEGHPNLHEGSSYSDRKLDGKRNKRYIEPKNLEVLVEKENKQMTKTDLKSGMTVKLRNGDVSLVINDFITDNNSSLGLADYDDNLVCTDDYTELDIVEVYQFTDPLTNLHVGNLTKLLDLTNPSMKLLWKRQELPKLSSAERVILENLDKRYKWIARDSDDSLYVYFSKPTKYPTHWFIVSSTVGLEAFPNLFKFVKWEDEQPYNIEELLKNC